MIKPILYKGNDVKPEYVWLNSIGGWCRLVRNPPEVSDLIGKFRVEVLAWGYAHISWQELPWKEKKALIKAFRKTNHITSSN